jgi:hypothetical protein
MERGTQGAGAPYVVVFFYEGPELRARIRNVQSQDQWIMRDAGSLREVLAGPDRQTANS